MSYIPLEKLLPKTEGSVYKMVNLAVKRAVELAEGAPALIKTDSASKPTTIALEEISQGLISFAKDKKK